MKIFKVNRNCLNFNNLIPALEFESKLPFIVDDENNVVFGNMFRKNGNKMNLIIKLEVDNFIKETLQELEIAIAEENSLERLYTLEEEFANYIKNERKIIESEALVEFREKGLITEENYIEPPAYNFEKHTKKKNKEEETFNLLDMSERWWEE